MYTYFGLPIENNADFKYIFEDVVRLPEFELFHMGLGMYRFREPVICTKGCFHKLRKKYQSLAFYYRRCKEDIVKLLFVKSIKYNIAEFQLLEFAMNDIEFASMLPKGYDANIDQMKNGVKYCDVCSTCCCDWDDIKRTIQPDRLLGFRWEPEQYYDPYGRLLYIMIDGCVAKRIAPNLYAFPGVKSCELHKYKSFEQYKGDRYPLISDISEISEIGFTESSKCAIVGKLCFDNGTLSTCQGMFVRYIAFDDIGISMLKRLYEYTIGYEYWEMSFVQDKGTGRGTDIGSKCDEQKNKNSYQIGKDAMELVKGIGYQDIEIDYRILFHPNCRDHRTPARHDLVYIENGILKLVDFFYNKCRCIPIGILAELSVVKKMPLCQGIEENLLIKVIDNVWYEKKCIGIDNYDGYMEDMNYKYHL